MSLMASVSEPGYKATLTNTYINTHSANKMLPYNTSKCKKMIIGNSSGVGINQSLEVDGWNISYDSDGVLCEEYIGYQEMCETAEQKYLGFIISCDAKNIKNIESKKGRVISITRQIIDMVKGLKEYTFQSAIIYIESLIRRS